MDYFSERIDMNFKNVLMFLHDYHTRVATGWGVFAPYLAMLYYVSIPSILLSSAFDIPLANTAAGGLVSFIILVGVSGFVGEQKKKLTKPGELEEELIEARA